MVAFGHVFSDLLSMKHSVDYTAYVQAFVNS